MFSGVRGVQKTIKNDKKTGLKKCLLPGPSGTASETPSETPSETANGARVDNNWAQKMHKNSFRLCAVLKAVFFLFNSFHNRLRVPAESARLHSPWQVLCCLNCQNCRRPSWFTLLPWAGNSKLDSSSNWQKQFESIWHARVPERV